MTTEWKDSVYPVSLDDFDPKLNDGVDHILANHPNSLATSIETIQQKLGIDGGPVTGIGGVEFSGVSNNPGAAGKSCLWTDNAGNLKFTDTGSNDSQILLKDSEVFVKGIVSRETPVSDANFIVDNEKFYFTTSSENIGFGFVEDGGNGSPLGMVGIGNGGIIMFGEGGLAFANDSVPIEFDDPGNKTLKIGSSIVGAINELHRPVSVIYAELSPDGNSPASTDYALPAGWYVCSFVKAEKVSGDCSAVTVRLLDGVEEIYKHAGPGGAGNDLDAEAMQDRNVFSMETVGSMLTIEVDSPAACVVRITLRVRVE